MQTSSVFSLLHLLKLNTINFNPFLTIFKLICNLLLLKQIQILIQVHTKTHTLNYTQPHKHNLTHTLLLMSSHTKNHSLIYTHTHKFKITLTFPLRSSEKLKHSYKTIIIHHTLTNNSLFLKHPQTVKLSPFKTKTHKYTYNYIHKHKHSFHEPSPIQIMGFSSLYLHLSRPFPLTSLINYSQS